MLSTIKSAFTTTPTPVTIDPSKVKLTTIIPVAESRYDAIESWGGDDKGEYGLATLKVMLNRVGLDMPTLDGKFVEPSSNFAFVTTKDRKPILRLEGIPIQYSKDDKPHLLIRRNKVDDVPDSTFNDALNVVTSWARGSSGGKKKRAKTYKKKRTSRKTRRTTH